MINYPQLSQNPKPFLSLTYYTIEEFQALLPYLTNITSLGKQRRCQCGEAKEQAPDEGSEKCFHRFSFF